MDELDQGGPPLGQGRLSGELFHLDHDQPLGPHIPGGPPPGTPPSDSWPFGGLPTAGHFMGRNSPGIGPHMQPPMLQMDGMPMVSMPRLMPPDDASQGYMDYPPSSTQNHVEVY